MKKFLGLILLIVAIGLVVGYKYFSGERVTLLGDVETVTVTGLVGSEKMGFLRNPDIESILAREYGLKLDVRKSGR